MSQLNYDYFITIVESESMTKAAQKLFVSQPSLSQYLKRLEANLGVELFDRSSTHLQLTFAGEQFYQYSKSQIAMEKSMRAQLLDIKNETAGRLRLGIAIWRGACLLPDAFPAFHEKYPHIQIELFEGRSSQLQSALMNDNLDLVIMNLPHRISYDHFSTDIIFEEPILLAAPTNDPYFSELIPSCPIRSGYPVVPVSCVEKVPLIITKPGQNLTYEIQNFFLRHNLNPDILIETGNLTTAINLTAKGICCTLVPEEGAKVCSHPGKVTYCLLDDPELKWPLAAVYRKGSYLPKLAKYFIASLKETRGTHKF